MWSLWDREKVKTIREPPTHIKYLIDSYLTTLSAITLSSFHCSYKFDKIGRKKSGMDFVTKNFIICIKIRLFKMFDVSLNITN